MTTQERVIKLIEEQLGLDTGEAKLESNLIDDLNADSLDMVELVMALEEEFEIEITDEEFEKCATVQDIIDLAKQRVAA